jgi:hypothetical protein
MYVYTGTTQKDTDKRTAYNSSIPNNVFQKIHLKYVFVITAAAAQRRVEVSPTMAVVSA